MENGRSIRLAAKEELPQALELVWRVFSEFEAPEYSREGVEEFRRFIRLENIQGLVEKGEIYLWLCHENCVLAGVLAGRPEHINLLFVEKEYHRRGIARALLQEMLGTVSKKAEKITVNSSPYAHEVYRRLGFRDISGEQSVNGIRFFPMELVR